MADYISREAAKAKKIYSVERRELVVPVAEIDWIPPADVVARDCYDRILAENDTMRNQLAKVGKKVGGKMEDVRPVVRARWEDETGYIFSVLAQRVYCPACKSYAYFYPQKTKNFCPNCGADMRPYKDGRRGEKDNG